MVYPEVPDGSELYLLDFTFQHAIMEELYRRLEKVTVLDHHATSQKDLDGFPNTVFDLNRSGCVIAWEFFHGTPAPLALRYIEDRDIFRNSLPFTEEIALYHFSLSLDFVSWDENVARFEEESMRSGGRLGEDFLPVISGKALLAYRKITIENIINRAVIWKTIGGFSVPAVNTVRELGTDICHALAQKYPETPFSAYFYEMPNGINYGLRGNNFDVSAIAKQYGGGGHRLASGFVYPNKTDDILLPIEK